MLQELGDKRHAFVMSLYFENKRVNVDGWIESGMETQHLYESPMMVEALFLAKPNPSQRE